MPRAMPAAPATAPTPARVSTRDDLRARLVRARANERVPPERYGFDLAAATRLYRVTTFLHRRWFRTVCHGIEQLPRGRVMLVANHASHALAWDGANILSACLLDAEPPRLVHAMADHRLMQLPILGSSARRIGAVDGNRATCIRLLRDGGAVLVFPEGARAHDRRFRDRYRLAPFGSGFLRVAMLARAPIVPVAVVGGEEEAPLLANPGWLKRLVGTHAAPITPTLVLPLPVRYRLHFGAPIRLHGPCNTSTVAAGVRRVREALCALLARGLAARRRVFW
ncbi:MAG: acyltransferase family protein [bacterium]|nr:acyltransferase family protein [bacterium]